MRILSTIIILTLVITLPYWIYLPAIFLGIIFFPFYIESVFLGLLVDTLYGRPDAALFGYPFAICAAVLVLFAIPLRSYIRYDA